MKNPWDGFCDIVVQQQPALTVSYRSANFVFEEGLREGRWVSLSYNAAGYLMAANPVPAPSYMDIDQFPAPQSFDVALDGQSLCSHFVCEGVDVQRGEGVVSGRVTLRLPCGRSKYISAPGWTAPPCCSAGWRSRIPRTPPPP